MTTKPSRTLLPLPNPHQDRQRQYEVEIECPEFSALCPVTGQPYFATITFKYIPGPSQVVGKFNVRVGNYTTVRAEYDQNE